MAANKRVVVGAKSTQGATLNLQLSNVTGYQVAEDMKLIISMKSGNQIQFKYHNKQDLQEDISKLASANYVSINS